MSKSNSSSITHSGTQSGKGSGSRAASDGSSRTGLFTVFESSLARAPKSTLLLAYSALVIALEFYGPWWIFVLPAALLGFVSRQDALPMRSAPNIQRRAIAGCTALIWVLMAVVRDFETHWRISPRLAGLFHLPLGVGIYVVLALVVFVMGGLAAQIGQTLRYYVRRFVD